jgi:hypothetical protein
MAEHQKCRPLLRLPALKGTLEGETRRRVLSRVSHVDSERYVWSVRTFIKEHCRRDRLR